MTNANLHGELVAKYLERLSADLEVTPSEHRLFRVDTVHKARWGGSIELELEDLPDGRVRLSDMGDTLGYLYVNGLNVSRTVHWTMQSAYLCPMAYPLRRTLLALR